MNELLGYLLIFTFIIICSFIIDYKKSIKFRYVLLIFLLIGFIDCLFYTITMAFPNTQIIKPHIWNDNLYFNWSAKIYSIIFALILLIPVKNIIVPDEIGLRIKQNKSSLKFSLIFLIFFFVVASIIGILSSKSSFNTEALLFLAIMPGLSEELIYRGYLLGLLNKIHPRRFKLLGIYFGWGTILTSIAFGLLHGFQLSDNYQLLLDLFIVLSTGIYGFFYALIRERSGSLIFPVIAHSIADFFNFFFRMV